ncbi:hypothetical protein HDU97_009986 [Phlyctochytrium planicorne]|nr:hypothetical protein HDU97_009986 [Phlyctochytrium planicorne]
MLNEDVLSHIFSDGALSDRDLLSCILVNRQWRDVAVPTLWRSLKFDTAIGGGHLFLPHAINAGDHLFDNVFWTRISNLRLLQKSYGERSHMKFTRKLSINLAFRLSLSLKVGKWGDFDLDEEDFDEESQQGAWKEFHLRIAAISDIMSGLKRLGFISISMDSHFDNNAFNPTTLWSHLDLLSMSIQSSGPKTDISLNVSESTNIRDPRYLSPLVSKLKSGMRRICIKNAESWTLPQIRNLVTSSTSLERFSISHGSRFSEDEITELHRRHGRTLQILELNFIKNLSVEKLFEMLPGFPNLRRLSLVGSIRQWNQESVDCCQFSAPVGLDELDIEKCPKLPDAFFKSIATKCPRLRYLKAGQTRISDSDFESIIAGCPALIEINLKNCERISSLSLKTCIDQNPRFLQRLNMSGCVSVWLDVSAPIYLNELVIACPNLATVSVGPVYDNENRQKWAELASSHTEAGTFAMYMDIEMRRS